MCKGSELCADEGACGRCGRDPEGRPGFAEMGEYSPHGKFDGLKEETLEAHHPPASAIGKAIEKVEHVFHSHPNDDAHCAKPKRADHDGGGGLVSALEAAMESAAAAVQECIACESSPSEPPAEELKGRGFDPFHKAQGNAAKAKAEIIHIQSVIHRGHCSLRIFCLGVAIVLFAGSVIGVLNLFGTTLEPYVYLTSVYNVVFAGAVIVMDVSVPVRPMKCARARKLLFEACWFLSTHRGKALFYFYVGSINLILLPDGDLRLIYLGTGGCLMAAGLWILTDGCGYCCGRHHSAAGKAAHALEDAAKSGANKLHELAILAGIECVQIKSHVQQHPVTLQLVCFFIALALFVSSALCLINVFNALFRPYHYLMAVYNVLFALTIALLDARRQWVEKCWNLRVKLLKFMPCLGWLVGRACFFFYVGSINLMMLPEMDLWKWIYIIIGGSLCVAGVLMVLHRYVCRSKALDDTMGFWEET